MKHSILFKLLISILILTMPFTNGCQKSCTDDGNLTSSEQSWIPNYSVGQQLTFQNEIGQVVTLVVSPYEIFHNRGYTSVEEPCNKGYQDESVNLTPQYNPAAKTPIPYQFYFYVAHFYDEYPGNLNSANINNSKFSSASVQSMTIFWHYYPTVYVMNIDSTTTINTNITTGYYFNSSVYKIYYVKGDGIRQFCTGGGHTWFRTN